MRFLKNSALIRNVAAVASGTAAGQAVAFAFSPLITRIYSPEVFGLQGVFLSVVSILTPAIALRYPMAIVVVENDDDARYLGRLSAYIAFGLSCLLGLCLAVAKEAFLSLLGAEQLGNLIWFLPPALLCIALQDIENFRAARAKSFRLLGIVTVVQAFLANLARVLGGLIAPVAGVLMVVTTVAPALQAAMLRFGDRMKTSKASLPNAGEAWELLAKHRDFPAYRVPTDVLNAASQSVPVIMLAALFNPAAAGLYALTRSVLNLPFNVIGSAAGNVLYSHFAEHARMGRPMLPLFLRSTAALSLLTPIIIGSAWFAPSAFSIFFGESWREAGYYAQWMALWLGVTIANIPAIRLAPVVKAQGLLLVCNIVMLIARVLAMAIPYWSGMTALASVAYFSIASLIGNVFLILVVGLFVLKYDNRLNEVKM